jgi:hypothetical protein
MSKLANHMIILDTCWSILIQSLDWIKINSCSDLFVWDVISNPPIRTGVDFKSSHFDPVRPRLRLGRDQIAWSKSSPVLIVGFEILHIALDCFHWTLQSNILWPASEPLTTFSINPCSMADEFKLVWSRLTDGENSEMYCHNFTLFYTRHTKFIWSRVCILKHDLIYCLWNTDNSLCDSFIGRVNGKTHWTDCYKLTTFQNSQEEFAQHHAR